MLKLWQGEPALILGLTQAALALLMAFGLHLSAEQVGAILAATAAILSLVVRAKVSPNPAAGAAAPVSGGSAP